MSKFRVKNPPLWKYALGVILLIVTVMALPYVLSGIGISLAAILTSSIVEKGSGKLGKDVIVGGKFGPFLRLRVRPSNPKTQAQMTARGATVELARMWRTLTATQRGAFSNLAAVTPLVNRLGFKRTVSGFQIWMKINKPLIMAGVPVIKNPAAFTGMEQVNLQPSAPIASITYDATSHLMKTFTLNFATLPLGLGATYLIIKCTSTSLSPGILSYKSRRYINLVTTDTTNITQPIDVFSAFTNIFGEWSNVLDKIIFIEYYQVDSFTGNMSAKQYCPVILVPPVV